MIKKELLILLLIILLFFAVRLPNLTTQPIFADEAIYIRWAQVMRAEPTLGVISLTDGKTPLFMWLMIPLFKIFKDPLFAGRFLSVISGLATLMGVYFLGWKFFDKKTAVWAAFLVAITPFMVFFDRMALVDSLLAAFFIWSLNLTLLLIRHPRFDLAMLLGYTLGGAILTKTPGMFGFLAAPFMAIAINFKDKKSRPLRIILMLIIGLVIGMVIYNLLRLGPGFSNLSSRNQDYVFAPSELIGRPLDPFLPHVNDLADWLPKLLTWPILLFSLAGIIRTLIKGNRNALAVLVWMLIPLSLEMTFFRTFTARYILFVIPLLLVFAGYCISEVSVYFKKLKPILFTLILLVLLVGEPAWFDFKLLTNLAEANLPKTERRGYLEDWTAGYGFKEIAKYLEDEAMKAPVVVGTEGSFGTLPDGLMIYLDKNRKISVIGGTATISPQIRDSAQKNLTFFVANKNRFSGGERLDLIREYKKAKGNEIPQDAILLFHVLPELKATK